ncbi:MAG: BamA/TamA family outer membrane protein [Bacteroidales bacterium]|nr:BamA/TamA family outer membrane protein [Bacteroidales bacterium]
MKVRLSILLACALMSGACSTTQLAPGQYKMGKSKARIVDCPDLAPSDVTSYIRGADIYSESVVESSVLNINNHLKYLGYYNSDIKTEVKYKGKKAKVTYLVHPEGRIRIDSILFRLPDNRELKEDFNLYKRFISVKPGDFLSEEALVDESDRSASFLRNRGFYDINKNQYSYIADSVSSPGRMILEYQLRTDFVPFKYSIGKVNIHHPADLPFRESVLRELNNIHPGDRYSDRAVNIVYGRFSNLKLFNSVNVELTPSSTDSTKVDCDITLTPSGIQGFKADVEASVNSTGLFGISPKLSYYHRNIFHGGEILNLDFNGNFQRRFTDGVTSNEFGASATLSLPRFLGISTSRFRSERIPLTEIKASYNYQSRPEYIRHLTSLSFSYTGNNSAWKRYLNYKFTPLRLNMVKLGRLSESFNEVVHSNPMLLSSYLDHIDAGVGANIYFSDASVPNPKTDFKYLRASLSLSGNLLSLFGGLMPLDKIGQRTIFSLPFAQYARAEIQLGKTFRFGQMNKEAFAARFLLGVGKAYGNSSSLPYEESFYCGGANSMRAWQARSLGPGSCEVSQLFSIPSQVGDMKIELDAEYRFPLFWKLHGAFFAEAGNVWSLDSSAERLLQVEDPSLFHFKSFYRQLALDCGIGLRMDIDLIVLRFDMGFKIHDPVGDGRWVTPDQWFGRNNFAFHFGVGYPF